MLTGAAARAPARTAGGGPGISRLGARQLAQRELARSIYKPSVWSRVWQDIVSWLESLAGHGSAGRPGWIGTALLTAGIVVVLAAVLYLAGPARLNRQPRGPVIEDSLMSAADHRLAADHYAAAGDYAAAIIERVRAIAVDLEVRQILLPGPGRTAAELGREAAAAIPAEAAALASVTRLFDDVRYGDRPGSLPGYQQVRNLDLRIRAVPVAASARARPPAAGPAGLQPAGLPLAGSDPAAGTDR